MTSLRRSMTSLWRSNADGQSLVVFYQRLAVQPERLDHLTTEACAIRRAVATLVACLLALTPIVPL
jgi:hypothetical protein